ncbi:MAG: WbqC family protein [Candidatus Sulfotelmatobacter sp.]
MKVAISQPSYLPWSGFFDLVDQVDQFVLLDDAQFVKQSWHQRNRIKSPSGLLWLTVPVVFRGRLGQPLCEVMIREPQFWEKHVRAVEVNYGKARYFGRYYPTLKKILQDSSQSGGLVDLNIELIRWLGTELDVKTPMVRSSALSIEGKRSARLVAICKSLGAADYVSPRSASYLIEDMKLFSESGLGIWFQNYTHPTYEQRFPPFVPFASVLDVLFNHGPDAGGIMRSGRGRPFAPDELQATAAECGASI